MLTFFSLRTVALSFFFLFFLLPAVFADDVIVFKNGDIVYVVVKEVTPTVIKYQKVSNLNGPIYSVEKSDILSIKYSNGEIEKFDVPLKDNNKSSSLTKRGDPVKAKPADDNEEQKNQYSILPKLNLKPSNKPSKVFFPIMAFTDSSVISTKELLIIIDPNAVEYFDGGWKVKIGYAIQFVNKTDAPIYIDRAKCFRRYNDYETKSYFDNKQYSVTNGNSSGISAGVGIGLIGVGTTGTSMSSNTESYGVDRFLVIGPKSKANLLDYKYIRLSEKKAKFKTVSDIEYWGFNLSSNNPVNQGDVQTYTESETPYSNKYFITYSTDANFENCFTIDFELYAKYLVGAEIKSWRWSNLSPTNRIVNEIKNTVPDFWTDCMSIIGMSGNYTK